MNSRVVCFDFRIVAWGANIEVYTGLRLRGHSEEGSRCPEKKVDGLGNERDLATRLKRMFVNEGV